MNHKDGRRLAIFEIIVWKFPVSRDYPDGIKYRAWLSEAGISLFGFDNHKPKGPHLHIREVEVGYIFRSLDSLHPDVVAMIEKERFIYEE